MGKYYNYFVCISGTYNIWWLSILTKLTICVTIFVSIAKCGLHRAAWSSTAPATWRRCVRRPPPPSPPWTRRTRPSLSNAPPPPPLARHADTYTRFRSTPLTLILDALTRANVSTSFTLIRSFRQPRTTKARPALDILTGLTALPWRPSVLPVRRAACT